MNNNKIEYMKRQFEISKMFVLYWHTRIVSGEAKTRKLFHGTKGSEMTDEEKTKEALDTMRVHINNMSELNDEISREMQT